MQKEGENRDGEQEGKNQQAQAAATPASLQAGGESSEGSPESASRLSKERIDKDLDAYRHDGEFTFRQGRPPRQVRCKETGDKYKGLTMIERIDLCCTAKSYTPSCHAQRIVDRNPTNGRHHRGLQRR